MRGNFLQLMAAFLAVIFMSAMGNPLAYAANPFQQGYIEGYLLELTLPAADKEGDAPYGNILVETYEGERYRLNLAKNAAAAIDRRPARLPDFKAGMEVYARISNRQVSLLEGYSTLAAGYIAPGGKVRRGIVSDIEGDQLIIKNYAGEKETYYISPATVITKKGKTISPDFLYPGDKVKLYFDEIYSDTAARVEVEGDSVLISNIYKGKLAGADFKGEMLVLNEVACWRNGRWQDYGGVLKLPYEAGAVSFIGGQKVLETRLPYYRGKDVYVIARNVLGRETAASIIIKNQYEAVFSDKVADINWYADRLELKDRNNFVLHEGSAVIRDGRLQDRMILGTGDDVLVIADGRGQNRLANIVYIYNQGINNSKRGQYYLYAGRLDQVMEYRLWLKDYFLLAGNSWESFSGSKELYFDSDTSFYDLQNKIFLKPDAFVAGDYAVDEYSERVKKEGLKDWYAYLYVNGDRIAAALLQPKLDSLLVQRVTGGAVSKIEKDELAGWTVTLRDASDWSQVRGQWMPRNAELRVNVEKALIIKEEKIISPEDLRPQDRLYILRDDFYGKVVIVK